MPPRRTSDWDLLQLTRDAFGDVAERPSSGIRYLSVHCDISALMQTDDESRVTVTAEILSDDIRVLPNIKRVKRNISTNMPFRMKAADDK